MYIKVTPLTTIYISAISKDILLGDAHFYCIYVCLYIMSFNV